MSSMSIEQRLLIETVANELSRRMLNASKCGKNLDFGRAFLDICEQYGKTDEMVKENLEENREQVFQSTIRNLMNSRELPPKSLPPEAKVVDENKKPRLRLRRKKLKRASVEEPDIAPTANEKSDQITSFDEVKLDKEEYKNIKTVNPEFIDTKGGGVTFMTVNGQQIVKGKKKTHTMRLKCPAGARATKISTKDKIGACVLDDFEK